MSKAPSSTCKASKKVCIIPFLRGLLDDNSNKNIICWTDKSNLEFRLLDQHKVAELWGLNKPGRKVKVMTYDTMSRSLREFCKKKLLIKLDGRRCGYRFVDSEASTENQPPLLFGIDRLMSGDFGNSSSGSSSQPSDSTSGTSSPDSLKDALLH
ncbi:Protein CBG08835 [Caenorhabditis briggsae]|uniref:ETS domain-containing protein n=2 Tax=Caenorhabditis briggsae TaxID=6238 RepID=A0AAE9F043_CAEBR|nr:Protein CBG08835 [Caenorhabditis briggsae]ULT86562.1 hypothetical protein L3Y34_006336 [Caenorhabditis briggsae]UMM32316.1 hypothetical protein L5515_006157 [Caenorhabditis briggsae]CAP28591.1 Protein CBG08835 [Caenorhabditis briggsae]